MLKSWLPSKEKSTDQTSSVWPDKVESSDQFSVDQSLIFWSALDDASSSPFGEKVNLEIKPWCPIREVGGPGFVKSKIQILGSHHIQPTARFLLLGEKVSVVMPDHFGRFNSVRDQSDVSSITIPPFRPPIAICSPSEEKQQAPSVSKFE